MKNLKIYHTIAPVFALFAVGCSSPIAMQSTEYDDMYYSSSDRTEYVQPQAQATAQGYDSNTTTGESAVQAQSSSSNVTDNDYADEYYDGRTYTPQATWNTPNYAYVDPYWTNSYMTRYNPRMAMAYRYDPFFDPFYDPFFYDPFMGRGSGLMVNIGIGYGMGMGGWGRPYHGYSNRWWPYNNYYNGFHHGYHHGLYGGNTIYYDRPIVVQPRQVQYGPRGERSVVPATGNERPGGRPDRTQSITDEQRAVQGTDEYARPGRAERSGVNTNTRGQQQQVNPAQDGKQVLPARPATTPRGYDPQSGQVRPSRQQPVNEQQIQRTSPSRQGTISPTQQRPVQRQERMQPIQRQERTQPVQRQQRPVQRTQPVQRQREYTPANYNRSESSSPVRSYEPARSSGTSSPPARSNSSSGGGRPGRGQ